MSANETQVGGTHYKAVIQHWDLAAELRLGYFEGQITKYLTRHRSKKGKEDVEKALHFTKKLRELAIFKDYRPMHKYGDIRYFVDFAQANDLSPLEHVTIMSVCNWSVVQDLDMLIARIERIRDECYPPVPEPEVGVLHVDGGTFVDSSEPGRGYIDQAKDI